MKALQNVEQLATVALLSVGAVLAWRLYSRGVSGAAADVVTAADGLAGGFVQGIGSVLGVSMTDAQKCAQAKANGDMVGASFYCAAADWAGTAGGKAVEAVGSVFGVPKTSQTECEKAIAEGRTWDASFACPAGDFIKYVFR